MIKALLILLMTVALHAQIFHIDGRYTPHQYRIDLPPGWTFCPTSKTEDTRLPIALFTKQTLKLEIHNFPSLTISPLSQIERWKSKIDKGIFFTLSPQSFSGFRGYKLESIGLIAFALELPGSREGEISSPVTLKITGDPEEILNHRDELLFLSRSFELRDPL
jgi:hypothetical protein